MKASWIHLIYGDHTVWSWSLVFWSVKPFQLFHSISSSSPRILILRLLIDPLSNEDSENQYLICGDEIVMKFERFQGPGQFGWHSKLPLTNAVVSALSLDSCRTVGSSTHCYLLSPYLIASNKGEEKWRLFKRTRRIMEDCSHRKKFLLQFV